MFRAHAPLGMLTVHLVSQRSLDMAGRILLASALAVLLTSVTVLADDDETSARAAPARAAAGVTYGQAGELQLTWTTFRTETETDLSEQGESKMRATLHGRLVAPAGMRLAGCMIELRGLTDDQNKPIITDEIRRWKGESLRQTVELDISSVGGAMTSDVVLDLPVPAAPRRITSVNGVVYALKVIKLESKDVRVSDTATATVRVGDQLLRIARVVRENEDFAVVFASRTTEAANLFIAGPKPFVTSVTAIDEGGQEIVAADNDRATDEVAFVFHVPGKRQVKSLRVSVASEIKEQTVPFELALNRKTR